MKELRFMVAGSPVPQGSKSARVYNGRAIMFEANKKLPAWRTAVAEAARLAMYEQDQWVEPFEKPVKVVITFFMPKPAKPKWAKYPGSKPDLDKLIRSVLDSLTAGKIWTDDSLAVEIHAQKLWTSTDTNSHPEAGCSVFIAEK